MAVTEFPIGRAAEAVAHFRATNAAILRRHADGSHTVFAEPYDALGHPSAIITSGVRRAA